MLRMQLLQFRRLTNRFLIREPAQLVGSFSLSVFLSTNKTIKILLKYIYLIFSKLFVNTKVYEKNYKNLVSSKQEPWLLYLLNKIMKRIINALSIIAIIAGVVLGTTGAYFSDTEISPTNVFAAGTLELSTDGEYTTMPIEVANTKPGDSDIGVIRLKNIGTITGKIEAAIINKTQDNENDCNTPEALDDITCADPGTGEGELDDYLEIILWIDSNNDNLLSTSTEIYFIAPAQNLSAIDNIIFSPSSQLNLTAEESADIKLKWQADPNHLSDNLFQGDDTAFTITFNFIQI